MNYMPAEISEYSPASTVVKKEEELTLIKDDEIKEKETKLEQEYKIKESIRKKYKLSDIIEIGEVSITAPKPRDIQVAKIESIRSVYGGEPDNEIIVTPLMETVPAAPVLLYGGNCGSLCQGACKWDLLNSNPHWNNVQQVSAPSY
jgi:hypothetical protein